MDKKNVKEQAMITPFEEKQVREVVFLMDFLLMVMMQGFR